jgi:hypothetical protein
MLCCVDKTGLSHDEDASAPSPVSILANRTMDLVHRNSYGDLSMPVALQKLLYFMFNVVFKNCECSTQLRTYVVSTNGHSGYRNLFVQKL